MTNPPEGEAGYTNDRSGWWGQLDDEQTPELVWPRSRDVYDRMRRQDAQVMSVLRAVTLPIRRTPWRIDPAGARPEVVQLVAEDLGLPIVGQDPAPLPRTKDRFSWAEHLRLALLMLVFGHSPFEQVARFDEQGRARLRKLAWRPPKTISEFEVAADGGLIAIKQHGIAGKSTARIPVDRLAVYVNDREGANWAGQSLLRPAYKFWLLKDRALRTQAQTIERNGLGVPVIVAGDYSDDLDGNERYQREQAEVAANAKLAAGVRAGDNSGISMRQGGAFDMKGVSGTLPDAEKVIRYYDEQIARAVLAHFLNLGTQTGSWALGSTFADFFTLSLQTVAQDIAAVTNHHVIEDIVDWNWPAGEPAPRLVFDEIGSGITAEGIKALMDCGALTPDDRLEQYLRQQFSLPAFDPSTAREAKQPAASPPPASPAPPGEAPPEQQRRFT